MESNSIVQFSESDIHSALAEIDRGLRSSSISDQYEVIAKIPAYVAKYPFPLFINASFLKLAEAFHLGTNLIRGSILRVLENCASMCLDKIISIDEIVRRVLQVSLSNDPVARGLCLRTIGQLVPLVAHRKNLHHLLSSSLTSPDQHEMVAAIQATCQFASHSKEFSASILEEVAELLQGVQTPMHIKLQLATVLSHMHADTSTTCAVVRLCKEKLLPECPSKALLVRLLHSLTTLACLTFAIVADQLDLLVDFLTKPTSRSVVNAVLRDLCTLAKHSPHTWNSSHVNTLISFAGRYGSGKKGRVSAKLIVTCMHRLVEHPFAVSSLADCSQDAVNLCLEYCLSADLSIALEACQSLICIAKYDASDKLLNAAVANTVSQLARAIEIGDCQILKSVLQSLVSLSRIRQDYTSTFCLLLESTYDRLDKEKDDLRETILQALLVLSQQYVIPTDWLLVKIRATQQTNATLFSLLLSGSSAVNEEDAQSLVDSCSNLWSCFQLARLAMRYAKYPVAKIALHKLCHADIGNQFMYHWLNSLFLVASAEAEIGAIERGSDITKLLSVFDKASISYDKAITSMHVARSHVDSKLRPFSLKLLKCRYTFLVAIRESIVALNCARIEKNSDALKEMAPGFCQAQTAWKTLSKCCFDADVSSLQYLRLQYIVSNVAYKCALSIAGEDAGCDLNLNGLETGKDKQSGLTHEMLVWAMDMLVQSKSMPADKAREYAKTALNTLVLYPFTFPRFFFQSLQETKVMLHLWPQPTGSSTWISVPIWQSFALKVEGVLQYCKRNGAKCRTVHQVLVHLKFNPPHMIQNCEDVVSCKRVTVNKDFFTAEFVLDLQESGTITVSPEFIDSEFSQAWDSQMNSCIKVNIMKA